MSFNKLVERYRRVRTEFCAMPLSDPNYTRWYKRLYNIACIIKRIEAALPRHT